MSEIKTSDLLRLAGVPSSDKKAAAWLREAIKGAQFNYSASRRRPRPADHNELIANIEKSARKLTKHVERLRGHLFSWRAFWRSPAFGPIHNDRVEVGVVLDTLAAIVRAADMVKNPSEGRPPAIGKQHVVDLAFSFFVRFSNHIASGTATGPFANFARAFYGAVTGVNPEQHGGSIDRQIRQAVKRLPVERQRAQRKTAQKP